MTKKQSNGIVQFLKDGWNGRLKFNEILLCLFDESFLWFFGGCGFITVIFALNLYYKGLNVLVPSNIFHFAIVFISLLMVILYIWYVRSLWMAAKQKKNAIIKYFMYFFSIFAAVAFIAATVLVAVYMVILIIIKICNAIFS